MLEGIQQRYERMMEPQRLKLIMYTSEGLTSLFIKSKVASGYFKTYSDYEKFGLNFTSQKGMELIIDITVIKFPKDGLGVEISIFYERERVIIGTPKEPKSQNYGRSIVNGFTTKEGANAIISIFYSLLDEFRKLAKDIKNIKTN